MSESEIISGLEHNDSLFESNFSHEESIAHANLSNEETPSSSESSGSNGVSVTSTNEDDSSIPVQQASSAIPVDDNEDNIATNAGVATTSTAIESSSSSALDQPPAGPLLTLRSLVTTKEAGIVIGKAGATVNELRDRANVKAGVSKQANGVPERVLTIVGSVEGVAQAYGMVARALIDSPPIGINYHNNALLPTPTPESGLVTLRLLVFHHQMGVLIGKQGAKIKSIQEKFDIKMVASKDILPQSTERVVEIQGTAENLQNALYEIGHCLMEGADNLVGTVLYVPHAAHYIYMANSRFSNTNNPNQGGNVQNNNNNNNINNNNSTSRNSNSRSTYNNRDNNSRLYSNNQNNNQDAPLANLGPAEDEVSDKFSISADMVGCLIGKGGTKIQYIRRVSGAKISISKEPDEETGERIFTITGTPDANDRAMKMVHDQLENEKQRRTSKDIGMNE